MKTQYTQMTPYITKDESEIRELQHPSLHKVKNQSLAEAIIYPGQETRLHKHLITEEIYHITLGKGLMTLGDEKFEVTVGDSICISPGILHNIKNIGFEPLKILCMCSPAYSHADTICAL